MKLVVDASVVMKWFVQENLYENAVQLLSGEHQLIAPDFLLIEISNIIWKKARIGDMFPEIGVEILQILQSGVLDLLPTTPLIGQSQNLAYQLDHSIYDCLYLSCAIKQQAVLITADRKFFQQVLNSDWSGSIAWIANAPSA